MTDSLPPLSAEWSPYEEPFHEIARVVEMSSGFVLVPVAVPGPDLARALAEWLSRAGHPVSVTQLQGDEDWERLAAFLMEQTPPPRGAVMVIGSDRPPQGYSGALALVNQVRDAVVKKLNCPLLWCGPWEFLNLTWENAPDFWSIRAVERAIMTPSVDHPSANINPSPPIAWSGPGGPIKDAEIQESLLHAALQQGDILSAAWIASDLAPDAIYDGKPEEALRIIDMVLPQARDLADPVRSNLHIIRAYALLRASRWEEMQTTLDGVLQSGPVDPVVNAQVVFLRASSAGARREYQMAYQLYEEAYAQASALGNIPQSIRARLALATMSMGLRRLSSARDWLISAFGDINKLGDPGLSSLGRQALARYFSQTHDAAAALRLDPVMVPPDRDRRDASSLPLCLVLSSPEEPRPLRQLRAHATPLLREGRMRWWSRDNLLPMEDPIVAYEQHAREAEVVVVLLDDHFEAHEENRRAREIARSSSKPMLVLRTASTKNSDTFATSVTVLRSDDNPPDGAPLNPDQAWAEVVEDIERLLPPVPQPRSVT